MSEYGVPSVHSYCALLQQMVFHTAIVNTAHDKLYPPKLERKGLMKRETSRSSQTYKMTIITVT